MGNWVCSCGMENTGNFCAQCGNPRPQMTAVPNQRPMQSPPNQQPPPRPQAVPPRPQAIPPRPQAVPPRPQAVPPRPQAVPPAQPPYAPPRPQATPPVQPPYAPPQPQAATPSQPAYAPPPRPQAAPPPQPPYAPPQPQAAPPPQPPYGAPMQPQYAPQKTSGSNKAVLIALIVGLVVVMAGGAFYFLRRGSDDNKVATTASSPSQVTENKPAPSQSAENNPAPQQKAADNNPAPPPAVGNSTAKPQAAPITMGDISSVSASSEDHEGSYIHSADLTIDGNIASCWSEGVPNDVALGSYLVYNFTGTKLVSGMQIWTGHQKSTELFYQNARPRVIQIQGSDGSIENVNLNDSTGMQSVTFSKPMEVSSLTLTVNDVYYGTKYSDTCIAEVVFF